MRLLQIYAIKQVIIRYTLVFLVGLIALLLSRFYVVSELVLQTRMAPFAAFSFVVNFFPHYVSYMVPVALYWAIYETVRRLSFNHELEAAFALGMRPVLLFLPFFVLGILASAYCVFLVGWVEPSARYDYRATMFEVQNKLTYLQLKDNVFATIDGQTILLDKIDAPQKRFGNIFLFGPRENSILALTAQSGSLSVDQGEVGLSVQNGNWLQTTDDEEKRIIENSNFEDLDVKIASIEPSFRERGGDEQEFNLLELYQRFQSPPLGTFANEMTTEFCRKLATAFSGLFLPFMAIAMGALWPRSLTYGRGLLAIAWLILYFELLVMGEVLSRKDFVSPFIFYGVLFFGMLSASIATFYRVVVGAGHLTARARRAPRAISEYQNAN